MVMDGLALHEIIINVKMGQGVMIQKQLQLHQHQHQHTPDQFAL